MVIAVVLDSTGERQACDVPCLAGLDGTVRRQTERFFLFGWDMWMTRDMKRKALDDGRPVPTVPGAAQT